MEVKDIINEGRPVEPYSFETDNEVTWYKIRYRTKNAIFL